jgi:hypothetical protein
VSVLARVAGRAPTAELRAALLRGAGVFPKVLYNATASQKASTAALLVIRAPIDGA